MDLLSFIASAFTALSPIPLEPVGDYCSYNNHSAEYIKELPESSALVHHYQLEAEDKACLNDWRKDSFRASVRLESAPVGLQLCVQMKPHMKKRDCTKTFHEFKGSYGKIDTQKIDIWVFWHPEAQRVSGSYKLSVSGV